MINNPIYNKIYKQASDTISRERDINNKQQDWKIFPAEVIDIILNDSHPYYAGEQTIGQIAFQATIDGKTISSNQLLFASPASPYIKQYPLKHEIVAIIESYHSNTDVESNALQYYYTDIINVWGMINQNALPGASFIVPPKKTNQNQAFPKNITNSTTYSFGDTFVENNKVQNLVPNEGDIIHLGRWGQSIRFGRTVSQKYNNWSARGNNGDPIIILQSSVPKPSNDILRLEDINKDDASIYIASNQILPLEYASIDKNSYRVSGREPKAQKDYLGSQVVLSSNRIILNSRRDHTIISSSKSIWLTSNNSINLDTNMFVANANKYQFGATATEPAVLGMQLVSLLAELINTIIIDTRVLFINGVPTTGVTGPATITAAQYSSILSKLSNIVSKKMIIE